MDAVRPEYLLMDDNEFPHYSSQVSDLLETADNDGVNWIHFTSDYKVIEELRGALDH